MKLTSILWIGVMLGMMSASLITLWETSKDPKGKKNYFYAGIIHKWVWLWVLVLLLGLLLWTADVISGWWVWMLFAALVSFLVWSFVLGIFRPVLAGIVIWGAEKVAKL